MTTNNNTIPPNEPIYLNQVEAAQFIRKRPRWLERTRYTGGGPPFRYIGRTPVYEKSALIAWTQQLRTIRHTSELN